MRIPDFVEKRWDRVKKWWDHLPKLPRKWRIVRNLALAPVLAVLVLGLLEWPALSPYRAFQRLEGAYLLTPSRLVLQVERGRTAAYLTEGDSWITVGSVETYNDAGKPLNIDKNVAILHQVLPKEGIVVVLLPAKNGSDGAVAAVWGGPEEGVSGTLELDLKGISSSHPWTGRVPGLETFTAQAERREDGWFIFQFVPHDYHGEGTSCAMEILLARGPFFSTFGDLEQPYRLTLTDSQGNTVAQQSGTTPPDQRLQKW